MKKKELVIVSIKDNIVMVEGEHSYQFLEEIDFGKGINGIVLKANYFRASVALVGLNPQYQLRVGDKGIATGKTFTITILSNFLGSIVDVNGQVLVPYTNNSNIDDVFDANKPKEEEVKVLDDRYILAEAKPIYARLEVNEPLQTGTSAIDGILPIGRGQKELIVGDSGTGKTSIAVTALISQRDSNVINIYVAIGKKHDEVLEIRNTLEKYGVLSKTIIVAASPDDSAAAKFLVPYVGVSIAEYYQGLNEDVLVVLDDMSANADAYREISLSSGAAPGREAYPGDIFYTQSRLLERCGKFTDEFGGGSITIIPIAQTLEGDISSYIPTNLISITDGQIFTSMEIFNEGRKPAIEISLSVSRLGSQVQTPMMIKATSGLRNLIANYENFKKFSSFNTNLSEADRENVAKGKVFELITEQKEYEVVSLAVTALLFLILKKGYFSFFFTEISGDFEKISSSFNVLKDVLKVFLTKDVLGKKLVEILNTRIEKDEVIELYLVHIILPLVKYHLLSENKWLRNNPEFIKVFKNIRNDGRVLLSYERRGIEKGIAYEI